MKNRYILLGDLPLIVVAAAAAFAARFDLLFYNQRPEFVPYALGALAIKPIVFLLLGMYRRYWQYASIREFALVVVAVTASSIAMAVFVVAASVLGDVIGGFSRIVLFNDWLMTLATAGGLRLAVRVVHESKDNEHSRAASAAPRRILVVGAGAAGTMVAREMRRNSHLGMVPVAFLDDDRGKIGKQIAGLPVMGDMASLARVVKAKQVDTVLIAMPTARGPALRAIVDECSAVGVKSQMIPGVFELLGEQVSVNRLRNVDITDLLRRNPIGGRGNVAEFAAGRTVLITGAGGSIGSELARQVASVLPSQLVLLGHGENSLFETEAQLRSSFPSLKMNAVVADIRDSRRLAAVFDRWRPDIVLHAAAHKHVPLMEENPEEAITNNVTGTRNVVNQSARTRVERFVLISTDKAVTPTSVMGASKRVAEMIVREAAGRSGKAFVVVRFGNVLGSRGSVVATFKKQIEQGGPVTVTHPDMQRFFMTIPEAVHLVLQASGNGKGGELFVLNMGQPIRIVELAQDLIKLSGLREEDIPIVFSGIRPGEKLVESLTAVDEQTQATAHPEVLQVTGPERVVEPDLETLVSRLEAAAQKGERSEIARLLEYLTNSRLTSTPSGGKGHREGMFA